MTKKNKAFSIRKRIESFKNAFNGLSILLIEEHNARIHLVAAIVTIIAGFYFHISYLEWMIIIFAIVNVFAMELLNSSIENIADFISPQRHETIKKIKDMAAAAVLVCAIGALAVGLIIFLPKI